jgi:ribosome recycling factor
MDNVLPVRNRAGRRRDAAGRRPDEEPQPGLTQDTQEQVVIEETLLEAEEKMEKAVVVAKEDFAAIRTGRAHPAMFNKIVADYYGAPTPINQLASFSVPELTEERRRDYIKVAKGKAEDARVSIRSVRRKAKDAIDKLIKDGEVGEDEGRRAEKELDDTTAKYVAQVDELLKHKEAELLEV